MNIFAKKMIKNILYVCFFVTFWVGVRGRLALIDSRDQQIEPAEALFVKIKGNSG